MYYIKTKYPKAESEYRNLEKRKFQRIEFRAQFHTKPPSRVSV
jgi:hypothetical protein